MSRQVLINTVAGKSIYLDDLRPGDIDLHVITTGLVNACRFAGQLDEFYSVAQHAILVSLLVAPQYRMPALHHDDSEALMGDMSRRLKHHPEMNWYRTLEGQVQRACETAVGISGVSDHTRKQIKNADDLAAVYERAWIRDQRAFRLTDIDEAVATGWIRRTSASEMFLLTKRLPEAWWCWDRETVRQAFMDTHVEVSGKALSRIFL